MRNFKKLLLIVIVLVVVAVTLLFVLENRQAVALTFLGWSGPELPVAILVILAFLLGLIIGPLFGTYVAHRSKRKFRRELKRQRAATAPTA